MKPFEVDRQARNILVEMTEISLLIPQRIFYYLYKLENSETEYFAQCVILVSFIALVVFVISVGTKTPGNPVHRCQVSIPRYTRLLVEVCR